MIKDILVNLPVSAGQQHAAEDFALSIASTLAAAITGVAFIYDTRVPFSYPQMTFGEPPPEVIGALKRENENLARTAVDRFAKAATLAGVPATTMTLPTSFAGSSARFGTIARRFDLAVVGQIEPGTNAYERNIAEGALFDSGRPMIVVPYSRKAPLTLDRVLVCWDGGAAAARAAADAMPLLARAGRIEVVTVAAARDTHAAEADLTAHLARHGISVTRERVIEGRTDVAAALFDYAADSGADFMVMGGHGHSRLRAFFLGSVTEAVLQSVKVPVLMSH